MGTVEQQNQPQDPLELLVESESAARKQRLLKLCNFWGCEKYFTHFIPFRCVKMLASGLLDIELHEFISEHLTEDVPNKTWESIFAEAPEMRERAQRSIEAATADDKAWVAERMCRYGGSDRSWGEDVIERAESPAAVHSALWMHCCLGSDLEWVERVIARADAKHAAEGRRFLRLYEARDGKWYGKKEEPVESAQGNV